jgi:uncharacterized integral membrane protein
MLTRATSLLLVFLMINIAGANLAFAGDLNEKKLTKSERKIKKRAESIKKGVKKLGVSKDSIVKVKMRDKTKIKGYISQIDEDSFTVTDKTGQSTVIEYTKAKQIKGNNLHAGVWIAIGVGAAIVLILLIFENYPD